MGLISYLKNMKKAQQETKLLILGLDCAGKTTILQTVAEKPDTIVQTKPTKGFNVKTLDIEGVKLSVWDLGGQKKLREYWSNYYENSHALIYVIDAADEDRVKEAGDELNHLLNDESLSGIPVLVFANKQDLVHALGPDEITEMLKLDSIQDRNWMIMACSAKKKYGLDEGFEWIVENTKNSKK